MKKSGGRKREERERKRRRGGRKRREERGGREQEGDRREERRREEGREGEGREEYWEEKRVGGRRRKGREGEEARDGGRRWEGEGEWDEEGGGEVRRKEIIEFGLILSVLNKLRRFFTLEAVGITEALGRVWAVILRKWLSDARMDVKSRMLLGSLFEMAREGKVLMRNCFKVVNVFILEIQQENETLTQNTLNLFYPLFLVLLLSFIPLILYFTLENVFK